VPIYEYRCGKCRKRSSALLPRWDAPDPPCPHCGSRRVERRVSTFATVRSGDSDDFGSSLDDGDAGDEGGFGGDDDDF
jgi:putative FmdB family regulatory protein